MALAGEVWDPVVIYKETNSAPSSTTPQTAGTQWVSTGFELGPNEVAEIFRIEFIPPVSSTGFIEAARLEILIDSKPVDGLNIYSTMIPADHPYNPSVAIDLGKAILHQPITGVFPSAIDNTTIKVKPRQRVQVRVTALDNIDAPYSVILKYARVRGENKLRAVAGGMSMFGSFLLDTDRYDKGVIPISIDTWDQLPGGIAQSKPLITPWFTYAINSKATTPNQWYEFSYSAGTVSDQFQTLSWNLVDKTEAYLVKAIGVHPHDNALALRLYVEGRITNPEFPIRPLPEYNYFIPALFRDTNINKALKFAGPRFLAKPFLFHNVKGGIQIRDNGTSIPANGIRIEVYGVKFVLR